MRVENIVVTTATGGAFTGYTQPVTGRLLGLAYVPHATTPIDTNGDIVITGETTTVPVLTKDNIGTSAFQFVPQQPAHSLVGAALTLEGTEPVTAPVLLFGERIKLVVANGGDAKIGTFRFLID